MFDRNKKWQSEIDRQIEEMLQDSKDLPGKGKPLDLREERGVPDDQRVAYKVMKDHNTVPEWMMMRKELDRTEKKLRGRVKRAASTYQMDQANAERMPAARAVTYRKNAEAVWRKAKSRLRVDVERHNDRVLTYNVKVPRSIPQRRFFDLEAEIQRALNES
jgi:hypothetical protein